MSETRSLDVLLRRWETHWIDLELPIATAVNPGASEPMIDAIERRVGLTFPDELRQWFQWHNGARSRSGFARSSPEAAPGWHLFSLDQAAERYLTARASMPDADELGRDPEEIWPTGYFPLMDSTGSSTLVVDVRGRSSEPAPIDIVDPQADLPEWPLNHPLPSIAALVSLFDEVFERELAYWDDAHGVIALRFSELPTHLRSPVW